MLNAEASHSPFIQSAPQTLVHSYSVQLVPPTGTSTLHKSPRTMALPMLAGSGAECGPSNALQGLTKRFDQDRGIQQDQFGSGSSRPGASREIFRTTQPGGSQHFDQDAARFFGGDGPRQQLISPPSGATAAFDFSTMHAALPAHTLQMSVPVKQQQQHQQAPSMNWASDFLHQHKPNVSAAGPALQRNEVASPVGMNQVNMPWSSPPQMYRMSPMMAPMPAQMQQQRPIFTDQIAWDREFQTQERSLASEATLEDVQVRQETAIENQLNVQDHLQDAQALGPQQPDDELAQIAGQLLAHVQHEQNPKFAQSQFLGLMKQLRDGEMVVKGNDMVQNDGSVRAAPVDIKGKGRAIDSAIIGGVEEPSYFPMSYTSQTVFQGQRPLSEVVQEDENDAYFRRENEEYVRYWENVHSASASARQNADSTAASKATPWDQLQESWDAFEATTTGVKPVSLYQFQSNNPYLLGDSSTRHHSLHGPSSMFDSVLALEAAVQRNMHDAGAWYELGVKQQENEREQKALQALKRAVELDPTHLPTRLALGVSYTNDGDRNGAYTAIKEWVDRNKDYEAVVRQWRDNNPEAPEATLAERFNALIPCLIAMATSSPNGHVDADVQIALAVLLNTNEDYEKAKDCFTTALAVRPDDWLLYNRVGATMANSGHAEEALQYYYRALELNPVYIRARYNLGISCINLRRYGEAAGHILDALALQESDGVRDPQGFNEKRGVVSTALWDSLKTACLHMQRVDLATICDHRDLDGFRNAFQA